MSKKKNKENNVPFSIVYNKKMKQKRKKMNDALSRRERLLKNYWKRFVKNKPKKEESNSPE